jgi:hypothetical protein
MQLIEEGGQWFWKNCENEVVSPKFNTKDEANKWYNLHNNWLESPAILR